MAPRYSSSWCYPLVLSLHIAAQLRAFHSKASCWTRAASTPAVAGSTCRSLSQLFPRKHRARGFDSSCLFRRVISASLAFTFPTPTCRPLSVVFCSSRSPPWSCEPPQHCLVWSLPLPADSEGPTLIFTAALDTRILRVPFAPHRCRGGPTSLPPAPATNAFLISAPSRATEALRNPTDASHRRLPNSELRALSPRRPSDPPSANRAATRHHAGLSHRDIPSAR